MDIFRRIVFAAVLAGAVAGLALALVQQWRVVPLIQQAEVYETAGHSHDAATADRDHAAPAQDDEAAAWAPADGVERTAYTIAATMLASVGFALLLGAISVLTGIEITPANGVLWGLGGFLAFSLAPAFGLPPELPGMPAADLTLRQIWWWATALCTGGAFLAIARYRTPAVVAGAVVIAALPHVFGAPVAPEAHSDVPAHLATAFAAAALGSAMIFWLIVGVLTGWCNRRFAETGATSTAFKGAQ